MYTLLPEEQVNNLQREYRLRVFILALLCLSGAIWIGIGSLLPSYIISVIQEKNAETQLQQVKKTTKAPMNVSVAQEVADSNAQILLVKNSGDPVAFSGIIEDIANHRINGISLNDIEIAHNPTDADPAQTSIAIRGTAVTRDILVTFQRALLADPEFAKVDLPISDLAKGTNISFGLSVTAIH